MSANAIKDIYMTLSMSLHGARMIKRYNMEAQLKEWEGILFDERNHNLQKKFEALETVIYQDDHYQTAQETEERQPSILRSLDFFNSIGPYLRILNVCNGEDAL